MPQEALAYLASQKLCVLAVEMPDGSPHAATVHYALTNDPVLIFETDKKYRKSEALVGRESSRASVVVGVSESDMRTLQMDGTARLLKPEDSALRETYARIFPDKAGKLNDPEVLLFVFTPTWWRYLDFTHPDGKKIIASTDV